MIEFSKEKLNHKKVSCLRDQDLDLFGVTKKDILLEQKHKFVPSNLTKCTSFFATKEDYENTFSYLEPPNSVPVNPLVDRLKVLLVLVERLENPSFAVSEEDLLGILFDLSALIRNADGSKRLNPDIHEDPADRSDDLGNVRMIHRPLFRPGPKFYEELADKLQMIAHQSLCQLKKELDLLADEDFVAQNLEYWDDNEATDLLAARKRIAILRKENEKLDRRNSVLFERIEEERRRKYNVLEKLEILEQKYQAAQIIQAYGNTPSVKPKRTIPTGICTSDENGFDSTRSRKSNESKLLDSQLENLKW